MYCITRIQIFPWKDLVIQCHTRLLLVPRCCNGQPTALASLEQFYQVLPSAIRSCLRASGSGCLDQFLWALHGTALITLSAYKASKPPVLQLQAYKQLAKQDLSACLG